MATTKSQNKWRRKNCLVKSQLNVMAKKQIHDELETFASMFHLKGKGEAVTFASFVTRALLHRADFSGEAAKILNDITEAYHRDRDIYQP